MMADNGSEYEVSRDSCVHIVAEIQGHLERKGVLGNRTRLWCSLQSSTLYMQKKQGDVMKTIDLKECHQVRKVTSEITGTHLEICERKKTHVFICPTSDNCTAWVRALQAAMALKDSSSGHDNNNQENMDDTNVYEVCDDSMNPPHRSQHVSTKLCSQYTEPLDAQKASSIEIKENEYWEVGAVQGKLNKSQPISQSVHVNNNTSSVQVYEDAKSEGGVADKSVCDQESYNNAYSLTQAVRRTSTAAASEGAPSVAQRANSTSNDVGRKDSVYTDAYSVTKSNTQPFVQNTNIHTDVKPPELDDSKKLAESEDGDSLFQILVDALSDRNSPIPDYIHPLTDEDSKPAEDLLQFISDNQTYCQVSYSLVPVSDDPVSSLKSYLETSGITSKGSF